MLAFVAAALAPLMPVAQATPGPYLSLAGIVYDGGFETRSAHAWTTFDDNTGDCVRAHQVWCLRIVPGQPVMNEVDCTRALHGACSLRLLHRSWGGSANQRVNVTPGAQVSLEFAFMNPDGGSDSNKWFTAYVFAVTTTGSTRVLAVFESKAPVTDWRTVTLGPYTVPHDVGQVDIRFSTGNGCGCTGTVEETWIDDVTLIQTPLTRVAAVAAAAALDAANCEAGAVTEVHDPECAPNALARLAPTPTAGLPSLRAHVTPHHAATRDAVRDDGSATHGVVETVAASLHEAVGSLSEAVHDGFAGLAAFLSTARPTESTVEEG